MTFETVEDKQDTNQENILLEKLKEKLIDLELLLFLPTNVKKKINAWIRYRNSRFFTKVKERSHLLEIKNEEALIQIRKLFTCLVQTFPVDTLLTIFSKRKYKMLSILKKSNHQFTNENLKLCLINLNLKIENLLSQLENNSSIASIINSMNNIIEEFKLLQKYKTIYSRYPLNFSLIQNLHKRICAISGRKKLNNNLLKEYLLTLKTYLEIEQSFKQQTQNHQIDQLIKLDQFIKPPERLSNTVTELEQKLKQKTEAY